MKATRRQLQLRYARRRFYAKKRAEFAALNLTTRGTPRIYTLHPELHGSGGRAGTRTEQWKRNARQRIYRAKYKAPKFLTPLELLHRSIREELARGGLTT